jgi:hypothetical protein
MHMTHGRHRRVVLIGDPVSKSDGSSVRDGEDDVYSNTSVNYIGI